jgi:hypothetical protein
MATPARRSAKKSAPKSQVFLGRRRGFPGFPRPRRGETEMTASHAGKLNSKIKLTTAI